jgi:hypothetical protein
MGVSLKLDATQAELIGNMMLAQGDEELAGQRFFHVPAGAGRNYYIPPPAAAIFSFKLPKSDIYAVWVRVKSPSVENQAYYINDGKGRWFTWLAGINSQWTWVKIVDSYMFAAASFNFDQGSNELRMGWCDDNVKVDGILITDDLKFVPE